MSQLPLVQVLLHELLDIPVPALEEGVHQVLALVLRLLHGGLQQVEESLRSDLQWRVILGSAPALLSPLT